MNFTDIFQKRSRLKNESKEEYRIALAGNPNVGKSTIFNNLTGMHQHTGNWTGKTVANATGECIYKEQKYTFIDLPGTYSIMSNSEEEEIARDYICFGNPDWTGKTVANATGECMYKEQKYTFIDLPGTYSIMSNSEEEEIARDYICFGNPDTTVVVVDATTLERNLNLVFQIMEITDNVILCVNLLDEAKKKKIKVDLKKLSSELGIPVVGTIARNKRTLDKLLESIKKACENKIEIIPKRVIYQEKIENTITKLTKVLKEKYSLNENMYRWISLKIIDGEEKIIKSIEKNLEIEILENKEIQSMD